MDKKTSTFFTFLLIISWLISLAPTQAKKTITTQIDALDNFYKAKFFQNENYQSAIDTSLFKVNGEDGASDYKIIAQKSSRKGDRIERLPGQPEVGFEHYGGYVTVDEKAGRAFYYYFAEAEKAKHSKPLLLWLDGGPGCSSVAYGAMSEVGPFRVQSDGKTLYRNPYAWNNAANVLFLESPAGVGFSYSNTSLDVETGGDKKTAKDNFVFLLNWLERFPEYKNRDFYLSGEGYAGHYVPQLAHNILLHNKEANKTIINLKGIIIGNAFINHTTDTLGFFDYLNTHALLSDEVLFKIKNNCDFLTASKKCNMTLRAFDWAIESFDIFNIYYPLCHNTNLTSKPKKASVFNIDPCNDYYVKAYLNTPQVQEALHANVTKITYDWQPCSRFVSRNWKDSPTTVVPVLEGLLENGLRVWVYSGDTSGWVPVTSTKYTLQKMNLTVKTPYYPWLLNEELGGYTQVYKEGLTFVTVRGAGHQVPSYRPAGALSLIMHFLNGTHFPLN